MGRGLIDIFRSPKFQPERGPTVGSTILNVFFLFHSHFRYRNSRELQSKVARQSRRRRKKKNSQVFGLGDGRGGWWQGGTGAARELAHHGNPELKNILIFQSLLQLSPFHKKKKGVMKSNSHAGHGNLEFGRNHHLLRPTLRLYIYIEPSPPVKPACNQNCQWRDGLCPRCSCSAWPPSPPLLTTVFEDLLQRVVFLLPLLHFATFERKSVGISISKITVKKKNLKNCRAHCGTPLGLKLKGSEDLNEPKLPIEVEVHLNIVAYVSMRPKFWDLLFCSFLIFS